MSLFLGPIHFWLYNKIQRQLDLVEEIVRRCKKDLSIDISESLVTKYGIPESRPLEEVIDVGNIHAWLQTKVSDVEYRLAFAVTEVLKLDSGHLEILKDIFREKGRQAGSKASKGIELDQVYNIINDTWLDGMPCDHAYRVLEESRDEVVVRRQICVHEQYWSMVEGNIKNYYTLRNTWNEAFAEEQNLRFEYIDDNTYKISRR